MSVRLSLAIKSQVVSNIFPMSRLLHNIWLELWFITTTLHLQSTCRVKFHVTSVVPGLPTGETTVTVVEKIDFP